MWAERCFHPVFETHMEPVLTWTRLEDDFPLQPVVVNSGSMVHVPHIQCPSFSGIHEATRLLGAPGIATRSKDVTNGAPGIAIQSISTPPGIAPSSHPAVASCRRSERGRAVSVKDLAPLENYHPPKDWRCKTLLEKVLYRFESIRSSCHCLFKPLVVPKMSLYAQGIHIPSEKVIGDTVM